MRVKKIVFELVLIAVTVAIAYAVGRMAFSYALTERGYEALGGEILVFPVVAGILIHLSAMLTDRIFYKEGEDGIEDDE